MTRRSNPASSSSIRSRYSSRLRAAAVGLCVGDLEAALDLDPHVLAVEVGVLGEELGVDARDLVHEEPADRPPARAARRRRGAGSVPRRPPRAPRTSGSAPSSHATATASSPASRARGLVAGHERAQGLLARRDVARHRPGVVEARREREAAVERDEAVRRLEADDPAAGGGDPDRAAGVRSERELGGAEGEGGGVPAARAARDAPGRARVGDDAEVRVLGGRPVRELVQVRLPDVAVAGRLERERPPRRSSRARARRRAASRTSSRARRCRRGPSPRAGSRRLPSGRARKTPGGQSRGFLIELEIQKRDEDGAREEQHEEPEERPAEAEVPAVELELRLTRCALTSASGSIAAATKSRARYASE